MLKKYTKPYIKINSVVNKELGCTKSQQCRVVGAIHKKTGEKVAIKYMERQGYNKKQIESEIKIIKKLRHKNIVELRDVIKTESHFYLVMEW